MKQVILALASLLLAASAGAQVTVKDAWVRATVTQQTATGAFMHLATPRDMKLVAARSPAAGRVEIHEMAMHDNVMHMRPVPFIALPAGKDVALQPGSFHIMMLNLHQQIHEGDSVPLTLVLEGPGGQREELQVQAVARALNSTAE